LGTAIAEARINGSTPSAMKRPNAIAAWASVLTLLLLANLSWLLWHSARNCVLSAAGREFRIEVLRTNGVSGLGIFERRTERPLWVEWDFRDGSGTHQEEYFFRGREVLDVTLGTNRLPKYGVYFRGPGKSATWWVDDCGSGSFTDRIYYNTNGDFYRREVWYNQAWRTVDRRHEKNGIVIDGQWRQLGLDTNGAWTTETMIATNRF
jgi:hypothetical protein